MKQLILVRHGKAEQRSYSSDFKRDLTTRGINDAHMVGGKVREKISGKMALISSPANRAIQTARIFAEELSYPEKQIKEIEEIYSWLSTSEFLYIISKTSNDIDNILSFGHNPAKMILAEQFAPEFDGHMPTSCAVGIVFKVKHWKDLEVNQGKLNFHYYPKMLK